MSLQPAADQDEVQIKNFLRTCLNASRFPPDLERVRQSTGSIDWPAVFHYSSIRYIAPLLYHALKSLEILPGEYEERLRFTYLETAQRNLILAEALKKLLVAFSEKNIECMPLKGLALAIPVYRDIAARPSRDIDLLLKSADLNQAMSLAKSLGYRQFDITEHRATDLEFENEIILFRDQGAVLLDMHWSLFDSPFYQRSLDMNWFWDHTIEFNLSGHPTRTLAPESYFIYLCGHMVFHHTGDELLWLNDIAELIDHFQECMDWQSVLAKASEFHLILPVKQVLEELDRDWHAPVPDAFREAVHQTTVTEAEKRIFASLAGERKPSGRHFLNDFQLLEGWGSRIRYSMQLLFPTLEYMRHRYKLTVPWAVPIYYPYRWFLGILSLIRERK